MRRLLPAVLCALLLGPTAARAGPVRSAIFFYPWYSNPAHDGVYAHWQQNGHAPPFDVASEFFPARGAYSSADPRVLRGQMREIAAAHVDEVVSSWWGWGSAEDRRLPAVVRAARRQGLRAVGRAWLLGLPGKRRPAREAARRRSDVRLHVARSAGRARRPGDDHELQR